MENNVIELLDSVIKLSVSTNDAEEMCNTSMNTPINTPTNATTNTPTNATMSIDQRVEENPAKQAKSQSKKEKVFFADMKPFVVQAVSGTFIAFLSEKKFDPITDYHQVVPILEMLLKIYLNICWHGYGKKDDQYVVNVFNGLLAHKLVKGSVCLIHWAENIGNIMIGALDLTDTLSQLRTMTRNKQRELININLAVMYDLIVPNISGIRCTGTCNDEYDGKDMYNRT